MIVTSSSYAPTYRESTRQSRADHSVLKLQMRYLLSPSRAKVRRGGICTLRLSPTRPDNAEEIQALPPRRGHTRIWDLSSIGNDSSSSPLSPWHLAIGTPHSRLWICYDSVGVEIGRRWFIYKCSRFQVFIHMSREQSKVVP